MVSIRPVKSDDLDALYAISLATGFEGGDASHLYDDPRLMGHIYSAPYAILEPHLGIVAEDSTASWASRLEQQTRGNGKTGSKESGGRTSACVMPIHQGLPGNRGRRISIAHL